MKGLNWLWGERSDTEIEKATAELLQRLRQNPQAVELLNDILALWMDSGAREDFDQYISDLMLEAENDEAPKGRDRSERYAPPTQDFYH